MNTLHRFIDMVAGTTIHINWFFLCGLMAACALAAGLVVRRR